MKRYRCFAAVMLVAVLALTCMFGGCGGLFIENGGQTSSTGDITSGDSGGQTPGGDSSPTEHVHSYGDWQITEPATCTESGTKTRTCDGCGDTETQSVPATGHTYGDDWQVFEKATCTEDGRDVRYCKTCSAPEYKTVTATGHTYGNDWQVVEEATCTEDGKEVRYCETCSAPEYKTVTAHGHAFDGTLIRSETYHYNLCSHCSAKGQTTLHNYGTDDVCDDCGWKRGSDERLTFTAGDDGTYTVTAGDKTATEIMIPDEYRGQPVVAIAKSVFCAVNASSPLPLASIEFGKFIKDIGYNAFWGCANLREITLPDSLLTLGTYAFERCTGLQSVTFGSGLTTIKQEAFWGCTGLKDIVLPDSLRTIGKYAFETCTGLQSVTFGSGLVSIGEQAFWGCTGLKTLTFRGGNHTAIGTYAFSKCTSLNAVDFGDKVEEIGLGAFWGCEGLASLTFPDSLLTIGTYAFENCTGLQSVTFGEGLETIEQEGFWGCSQLASLEFPDSLRTIGKYAFSNCTGLKSVDLGEGLESIADEAFWGCANIPSLTFPDSFETLGSYVFSGCTGISEVKFGTGLKNIGYCAFNGCTGLETADLGDGTFEIEDFAFWGCSSLTDVSIGNNVEKIGYGVFSGSNLNVVAKNGVNYIGNAQNPYAVAVSATDTSATTLTLDDGARLIMQEAFRGMENLRTVNLGKNLRVISTWAFAGCKNINEIVFGDCVERSEVDAFNGVFDVVTMRVPSLKGWLGINFEFEETESYFNCGSMPFAMAGSSERTLYIGGSPVGDVVVPDDVEAIYPFAFAGTGITSIRIGSGVRTVGRYAFTYCDGLEEITVAAGNEYLRSEDNCVIDRATETLITGCKNSAIPSSVKAIADYAFYECKLNEGTSGGEIVIGDLVETIGDYALYDTGITKITIGKGLKTVGGNAMYVPYGIKKVYIQMTLDAWCRVDFEDEGSLPYRWENHELYIDGVNAKDWDSGKPLSIPSTITELKPYTFYNIDIHYIHIPAETVKIDPTTFAKNANLLGITVDENNPAYEMSVDGLGLIEKATRTLVLCPTGSVADFSRDNILKIGDYAFAQKGLESIILPEGVTEIGYYAFAQTKITALELPATLQRIETYAFYQVYHLKSINIPASVNYIGRSAFFACSELTAVDFENKEGWTRNHDVLTDDNTGFVTEAEAVDPSALADPSSAAAMLKDTDYDEWEVKPAE